MQENMADNKSRVAAAPEENETRAFSKRLNAAKEKWRTEYEQELFERLALTDPGTGEPITNSEQLIAILDTISQPEQAESPEMVQMRAELARYRDAEEEQQLSRNERLGDSYGRLRDEVRQLTDYARSHGKNLSLTWAFYAVLLSLLDELLEETDAKAGQRAMAQLQANAQASPAALGGTVSAPEADYRHMTDEEFDRVVQMALNGELRRQNGTM